MVPDSLNCVSADHGGTTSQYALVRGSTVPGVLPVAAGAPANVALPAVHAPQVPANVKIVWGLLLSAQLLYSVRPMFSPLLTLQPLGNRTCTPKSKPLYTSVKFGLRVTVVCDTPNVFRVES